MNRRFAWRFIPLTLVSGLFIAVFLATAYWLPVALFGLVYFCGSYFLYSRYVKRVLPRPLAPAEANDIYFPRSDIPRPLYEDQRKYPKYLDKKKQRKKRKT